MTLKNSRIPKNARQRQVPLRRRLRLESLEQRHLLSADLLFADSFEVGQWNGNWVEDSQNAWFRSTQKATDGSYSAAVNGTSNDATLTLADPLNLTPYETAELTFSWLISSSFVGRDYLAVDVYDGSWQEVARLRGNSDLKDVWHHETIDLSGYQSSEFMTRFRAKIGRSHQVANVDNVKITGTYAGSELAISDAQVIEGDSGTKPLEFTVTRSGDTSGAAAVDYETFDGTATAGSDYVATSGTLYFAANVTSQTIAVLINGDTEIEPDEHFFVKLSNPVGATISNDQAVGTILDDDADVTIAFADFSDSAGLNLIGDALIANGNVLRLTPAAPGMQGAAWYTEKQFAAADWETTFEPGIVSRTIIVPTIDDTEVAPDEQFSLVISNSNVGTIVVGTGTGTIVSSDAGPPNQPPVAVADSYWVDQDSQLFVPANGVLANDYDVDGDVLTAVPWSGTSTQGGQVVLNSDGSFTYTPPPGFTGTDSFDYLAFDGSLTSNLATVSIEVQADNANAMYVYDIRFEVQQQGPHQRARAVFEIRWDSNGNGQGDSADARLAGVSITVLFAGQTYTGTTDSNGIFRTDWIRNPGSGTYAEVVDLALTDYAWDPLALDLEDDSDGNGLPDAQL